MSQTMIESAKIDSESVMDRASKVSASSLDLLEKLGPLVLTRLGLLYNRWHDRNSRFSNDEKVTFATWVDNFDRVNTLFQENLALRSEIDQIKKDMQEFKQTKNKEEVLENIPKLDAEETLNAEEDIPKLNTEEVLEDIPKMDTEEEDLPKLNTEDVSEDVPRQALKIPKTEEEFQHVRKTIYAFNKKNYKLLKENKKENKWGEDDCYNRIVNKKSLVAWLKTPFAISRGLGTHILEDFSVCVVDDCLVTTDRDFKGGVGIEAFWIPPSRYASVSSPSNKWKSEEHKDSDPRHEYSFKGLKWVPEEDSCKRARIN